MVTLVFESARRKFAEFDITNHEYAILRKAAVERGMTVAAFVKGVIVDRAAEIKRSLRKEKK